MNHGTGIRVAIRVPLSLLQSCTESHVNGRVVLVLAHVLSPGPPRPAAGSRTAHLLHLIGGALQVAHMLPDVAQIAEHDEVASQYKRHFAGR